MKKIKIVFKIISDFIVLCFQYIQSRFYENKDKYKDAWLFCERGIDAGDNAYWMFKYICHNHPEINAYYVIDSNNDKAYKKVKKIGKVIQYNSYEHKMAFMLSKVYVCTHYGYITRCNYHLYKMLFVKKQKYIFLQHGITQNDISKVMNKLIIPLDLFITSTKKEYKSILEYKYGYSKDEVKLTGMPRFDNLKDTSSKKAKQILFMPTWRNYIATLDGKVDKERFINTEYYKVINSFLSNKLLIKMLEKNNIRLLFYPHHEIQRYIDLFETKSKNIIISKEGDCDVQDLLKKSNLLITDYSSIHFDFAYMKKPIIYYQFDRKDFFDKHYNKGYFDYTKDGFGKVCITEKELLKELNNIIEDNMIISSKYIKRVDDTFVFTDNNNCERIYNEIKKIL